MKEFIKYAFDGVFKVVQSQLENLFKIKFKVKKNSDCAIIRFKPALQNSYFNSKLQN